MALSIHIELPHSCKAYLCIDSVIGGTSSGGVRICENIDEVEAQVLAREMTSKYCWIGIEKGGGKTGLQMPSDIDLQRRNEVLRAFGEALKPIFEAGLYWPGTDINCSVQDLLEIYAGAAMEVSEITDTSYFTAISLGACLEAVRTTGGFGSPMTLAIEGFGAVASHLVGILDPAAYRIVAISTLSGGRHDPEGFDFATLQQARGRYGDAFVDHLRTGSAVEPSHPLFCKVDVVIPAARTWAYTAANADDVKARAIVPAANAPYKFGALESLNRKGVICIPGYVANCGGVFGSMLVDKGVKPTSVIKMTTGPYREAVTLLLEISQRCNKPVEQLVESVVEMRGNIRDRKMRARPPLSAFASKVLRKLRGKPLLRSIRAEQTTSNFLKNLDELNQAIRDVEACL